MGGVGALLRVTELDRVRLRSGSGAATEAALLRTGAPLRTALAGRDGGACVGVVDGAGELVAGDAPTVGTEIDKLRIDGTRVIVGVGFWGDNNAPWGSNAVGGRKPRTPAVTGLFVVEEDIFRETPTVLSALPLYFEDKSLRW